MHRKEVESCVFRVATAHLTSDGVAASVLADGNVDLWRQS